MNKPKIALFAYHQFGHDCLKALLQNGENIAALYTHKDAEHENIWFDTPATLAKQEGIATFTPENINHCVDQIRAQQPDLILSIYFRQCINEDILNIPRLGAFNMHGSLLPKFRGRCPINWAIIHGETRTGLTLHSMVKKIDAGAIVDQIEVPIHLQDTALDVLKRLFPLAPMLLMRNLNAIKSDTVELSPQDTSKASYFGGRGPSDGKINWSNSALDIHNLIRAVTHPYPGAFCQHENQTLYIWRSEPIKALPGMPGQIVSESPLTVATAQGALKILAMQWQGGPEIISEQGHDLRLGMQLQ